MTDTTTMTVPAPAHLAVVHRDGDQYRAECAGCGWVSGWQATWVAAAVAGAEHRDTAAGPPDEMDVLMSAMLDLQDDLASVVVWLAENWSADLPAPRVHGTDFYAGPESVAGARLNVCCANEAMLDRAARRLGVPVRIDPAPDTCGYRYRRASRRFGRVEVVAFAGLQPEDEHRVEVVHHEDSAAETAFDAGAERVRAECSCGWAGAWRDEGALAEGDGDDHREVVG